MRRILNFECKNKDCDAPGEHTTFIDHAEDIIQILLKEYPRCNECKSRLDFIEDSLIYSEWDFALMKEHTEDHLNTEITIKHIRKEI